MRVVIGGREQTHVRIGARNIERGLVARFFQCEGVRGVGNDTACERDTHAFAVCG